MIRPVLRGVAIAVALAGAIDPSVTSQRPMRPEVALVAEPSVDRALIERAVSNLAPRFAVVRAPFAGAAGTVVIGDRLPPGASALASPVFSVLPDHDAPTVALESVVSPIRAPLDGRVPIAVRARASHSRGRKVVFTLSTGGLVVDEAERELAADEETLDVTLNFIPTATGATALSVAAALQPASGAAPSDAVSTAMTVVEIQQQRWSVLFYDARPSWMSTFVRRALERDPRFVVTSRVVTSRVVSTDAGRPPSALDRLSALGLFDAVVVGAPEALTDRDVSGLDALLRRRAGGVILLLDRRALGPYERLADAAQWGSESVAKGVLVTPPGADGGALRASDLTWPMPLPAGATLIAGATTAGAEGPRMRPVIWRSPVGAGRLVVSGALDAWRFRDRASSTFDSFWPGVIAEAADAGAPLVDVRLARNPLMPSEWTEVSVQLRDAKLAPLSEDRPVRASVSAFYMVTDVNAGTQRRVNVRLWPDGPAGSFHGSFRAPPASGNYSLVVTADGVQSAAPIVVASSVTRPAQRERDLVAAWSASRGGEALPASRIGELADLLSNRLQPARRAARWHPMRSPWWMLVFSVVLAGEWWMRRRRGLA